MVAGIWHKAIKKAHAFPKEYVGLVCPITLALVYWWRRYVVLKRYSGRSGVSTLAIHTDDEVPAFALGVNEFWPLLL